MSTSVLFRDGDIVLDDFTGDPVMVSGRQKASQDVLFVLQSNEPYGAGFPASFGSVPTSGAAFSAELTRRALAAIRRLQSDQRTYRPDRYTPDERVVSIEAVRARQDPDDPTTYRFFVRVRLGGNGVVEVTL